MLTFQSLLDAQKRKYKRTLKSRIPWTYEMMKVYIAELNTPSSKFSILASSLLIKYPENSKDIPWTEEMLILLREEVGKDTDLGSELNLLIRNYSNGNTPIFRKVANAILEDVLPPPAIGDFYEGGVIFYINGSNGLATQVADTSDAAFWGLTETVTNATGTAIGTGEANTDLIVADQGAGVYAAKLCKDVTDGGNSDWYLPSKDELNEMYLNKTAIDATSIANGGVILDGFYWSSTEIDNITAWTQLFANGGQYSSDKYTTYEMRAIRNVTL